MRVKKQKMSGSQSCIGVCLAGANSSTFHRAWSHYSPAQHTRTEGYLPIVPRSGSSSSLHSASPSTFWSKFYRYLLESGPGLLGAALEAMHSGRMTSHPGLRGTPAAAELTGLVHVRSDLL